MATVITHEQRIEDARAMLRTPLPAADDLVEAALVLLDQLVDLSFEVDAFGPLAEFGPEDCRARGVALRDLLAEVADRVSLMTIQHCRHDEGQIQTSIAMRQVIEAIGRGPLLASDIYAAEQIRAEEA